jgi:hypothetical protein
LNEAEEEAEGVNLMGCGGSKRFKNTKGGQKIDDL